MRPFTSLIAALNLVHATAAAADLTAAIRTIAGPDAVVYAVDASGRALVDIRSAQPFMPASILKVFTVQLAATTLGLDFRFATEFYLDRDRLVVKGHGDPLLVSEELDLVAAALKPRLVGYDLQ